MKCYSKRDVVIIIIVSYILGGIIGYGMGHHRGTIDPSFESLDDEPLVFDTPGLSLYDGMGEPKDGDILIWQSHCPKCKPCRSTTTTGLCTMLLEWENNRFAVWLNDETRSGPAHLEVTDGPSLAKEKP